MTKRELAHELKKLLQSKTLEKISIGNICEQCGLNRKSFYYHFQDKYDLVNWIFYNEFTKSVLEKNTEDSWDLLKVLCEYLFQNKEFYSKVFRVEGQNSFTEYFSSFLFTILSDHLSEVFKNEPSVDPYAEFYSDAFVCSIKKWLCHKDPLPPYDFAVFLRNAILGVSMYTYPLIGSEVSLPIP